MKPIDPAEISAFLDSELDPERTEEVRQAISCDAVLRQVHDGLLAVDGDLKAYAVTLKFRPQVAIDYPWARRHVRLLQVAVLMLLLVLRVSMKFAPAILGNVVECVMLIFVVGWVLRSLVRASDQDCSQLIYEIALNSG